MYCPDAYMSDKKPTEEAIVHFGIAKTHTQLAHQYALKDKGDSAMFNANLVVSLYEIADGLANLATGLRATYILLDEVKRLLEQQRVGRVS
jgi:hypothetical protein